MIAIIMTYWNRQRLLDKTLASYIKSESRDFKVYIVDNNSDEEIHLGQYPFEVEIIRLTSERWANNYISAHNYGFYHPLVR
jgi:glycosyltransferase involved in cell wall biosynthesis